MPKIKVNDREERNRVIRAILAGNRERYGVDIDTLATYMGVSSRTAYTRLELPETMLIKEVQGANKILRFTPIQAASIVLGRNLTAKEIKDFLLL